MGTPLTSSVLPASFTGSGRAAAASVAPLVSPIPKIEIRDPGATTLSGAATKLAPFTTPPRATVGAGELVVERGVASPGNSPASHRRPFRIKVWNRGLRHVSSK